MLCGIGSLTIHYIFTGIFRAIFDYENSSILNCDVNIEIILSINLAYKTIRFAFIYHFNTYLLLILLCCCKFLVSYEAGLYLLTKPLDLHSNFLTRTLKCQLLLKVPFTYHLENVCLFLLTMIETRL